MAILPDVVQIDEFESAKLFVIEPRASGTYQQVVGVRGNSLLSSVFVKSIDPGTTIQVNYFDTTTGSQFSERFDLDGHDLIDDTGALNTFRILVGRIHQRVVCEVIVAGGSAEFGIFATAVSSSASDIDSALAREGEDYTDPEDKAIPIAYLDESTDQLFFVKGENGAIKVTGTVTALAGGKATPISRVLDVPLASTEYPLTFATNMKCFCLTNETNTVTFQLSWQVGESATNFFKLKPGQIYSEEGIIASSLTLYVQGNKAAGELKIVEWT